MRYFKKLKSNWEKLASDDPLWAILTEEKKRNNQWNIDEFFTTGLVEIEEVINKIKNNRIFIKYDNAIDFGCGVGRLTQAMGAYFKNVNGIDISQQMVAKATELNRKKNCLFHVVNNPKFENILDSQIDFIYSNITLQHIQPQYVFDYLLEFNRVLNTKGILIFQLPDKYNKPFVRYFRENVFLYKIFLKIKYLGKAKMETYCIPKEKIISFMENQSFELKLLEENKNAGPKWRSYTYYFMKK